MRIDKLIEMLEEIKEQHGLLDIKIPNEFNGTDDFVDDVIFVEGNSIFDDGYAKIT